MKNHFQNDQTQGKTKIDDEDLPMVNHQQTKVHETAHQYEQDQKSKNPERKTLSEMFFGKIDRMVNGERAHPQVNNDETENNSQPQIHQTPKTPNTKIRGMTQG